MKRKDAEVSVSNAVTEVCVVGKKAQSFAVRDVSDINLPYGVMLFEVVFTELGRYVLETLFGADKAAIRNSRYILSKEYLHNFEQFLLQESLERRGGNIDWNIISGLSEVLTADYRKNFGFDLLTAEDDIKSIKLEPIGLVRQPEPSGKNSRGKLSAVTAYFMQWRMVCPEDVYAKLTDTPALTLLSAEQLSLTDGGRKTVESEKGFLLHNIGITNFIKRE